MRATQLRPGMTIRHDGDLYTVHSVEHRTPGNKRAAMATKMRNLRSGSIIDYRFRAEDNLERAIFEEVEHEYLYSDNEGYHFMNSESYEQFHLNADVLGEAGNADPVFHLTHGLYEEPSFDLTALNPEVLQASGLASEELEWLQESIQQPGTIDWQAYALRRFAGFRPPERHAIIRYLEYRAAHTWDFVAEKINAALDSYWRSSPGQD